MDQLSPAIITSKDGACVLIEGELEDLDDAVFAPMVCGMTDADERGRVHYHARVGQRDEPIHPGALRARQAQVHHP